jgi:hypothetical protein
VDRPLYIQTPPERVRCRQPEGWGSPVDLLHQSITEIKEHDFIAMFLSDLHYRNSYLNIKGLEANDAVILQDLPLRRFRKNVRGDVDILVVPTGRPEQSTAIQVKRYKIKIVSDDADHTVQIKRMSKLFEEGVRQANENAVLGFSQVYLWIAVLTDSRIRNDGRYTYDGADSQLRSAIENTISTAKLHPRVGLIRNDFVQAMDRPPFALSSSGLSLKRLAVPVTQPADLTGWLTTLKPCRKVAPSWSRKAASIVLP